MTDGSFETRDVTPPPAGAPPWYALGREDVADRLQSGPDGLTAAEVAARQARYGRNELEEEPPTPVLVLLARQFRSPLIYILVAAAVATVLLAEYIDASVIAAVLFINAAIGFTQERKAEGAVRALMQLVVPHARVVRDGQEWEIDSPDLVPGDVVLLEPGARIPADLRLVSSNGLKVDESLLTGESLAVVKGTRRVSERAPLADRTSMAFTGTVVTSGRGRGIAVATGTGTELGAIARLIRSEEAGATPLQQRMARFAGIIGIAVGVSAIVAFVSGIALGEGVGDMFLTAVALAVAAIPEGLPVVFTITLALGVRRMARRNAVVRRLPAVETLGSTTVIGSDKTGTLTENRMTVQRIWAGGQDFTVSSAGDLVIADVEADGENADLPEHPGLRQTVLAGALANEAEAFHTREGIHFSGDPTEVALLVSAMAAGLEPAAIRDAHPMIGEIPFEPERRYSASVRSREGTHTVFVKGAPERLVEMCTHMLSPTGPVPIDRDAVHAAARRLAADGLRVLAMAYRDLPAPLSEVDEIGEPEQLVFVGLQGMMDPPRAGVREAVATCHGAGIRVVMITGDHAITARAIGQQIGIAADGEVLTGADLAAMSDDDLHDRCNRVNIYARVSPDEKLRIVHALQRAGNIVAVTGDGVNDAPALKAAAIGVAMGRSGTDVAREAAEMVLADDNFVSIAAAVEEGRVTFDNVRKVTFFLVSTGAATIIAILAGVWMGWPLLMVPAQLLWLNLVTKGLQDVALAFEPGEEGTLRRPPRALTEGILSRVLWERTLVTGFVMAAGTLALFRWELDRTGSLTSAQTIALTTMVIYGAFHVGNARSETKSLLQLSPVSNRFLFAATIAAVGVHAAALYLPPTQFVLRVEPIDLTAWVLIIVVATSILVVMEADKLIRRQRQPQTART